MSEYRVSFRKHSIETREEFRASGYRLARVSGFNSFPLRMALHTTDADPLIREVAYGALCGMMHRPGRSMSAARYA